MAVGAHASSLNPKAARILPDTVTATWEVHHVTEPPHWSESPTNNPHRHCQKKEKDPHLHTDKIQQEQRLSDYTQQNLSIVIQRLRN
jgi:hypothetical protein